MDEMELVQGQRLRCKDGGRRDLFDLLALWEAFDDSVLSEVSDLP